MNSQDKTRHKQQAQLSPLPRPRHRTIHFNSICIAFSSSCVLAACLPSLFLFTLFSSPPHHPLSLHLHFSLFLPPSFLSRTWGWGGGVGGWGWGGDTKTMTGRGGLGCWNYMLMCFLCCLTSNQGNNTRRWFASHFKFKCSSGILPRLCFVLLLFFFFFYCGGPSSGYAKTLRETQCSGVKREGKEEGEGEVGEPWRLLFSLAWPMPALVSHSLGWLVEGTLWVPVSSGCQPLTHIDTHTRTCIQTWISASICLTNDWYKDKWLPLAPSVAVSDFLKSRSRHSLLLS